LHKRVLFLINPSGRTGIYLEENLNNYWDSFPNHFEPKAKEAVMTSPINHRLEIIPQEKVSDSPEKSCEPQFPDFPSMDKKPYASRFDSWDVILLVPCPTPPPSRSETPLENVEHLIPKGLLDQNEADPLP
jgi:hypothetical protein